MAKKDEAVVKFETDTKGFTSGIKSMITDMNALKGSLKLNAAELKNNSGSVELLQERQELLSQKLADAQKKVALTNQTLEVAKERFSENSDVVRGWEKKLLSAQIEVQYVSADLGRVSTALDNAKSKASVAESAVGKLTQKISEQESELAELKQQYVNAVLEYGETSDEAQALAQKISSLSGELADNKDKMAAAKNAADELGNKQEDTRNVFERLNDTISEQETELAALKKAYANAVLEYGETSDETQALAQEINSLSDELADNKDKMAAAKDAADELGNKQEDTRNAFERLNDTISEQETELAALKKAYANAVLEYGETSDETQALAQEINSLSDELADNKDKMMAAKNAADELGNSKNTFESLSAAISEQETELSKLKSEYASIVLEQGKISDEAQALVQKISSLSNELTNNKDKLTAVKDAADELGNSKNAFESLSAAISEQETELSKLKSEYASVVLEQGKTSDEAQALAQKISSLSGELADNKDKLTAVKDAADELGNSKNAFESLSAAISKQEKRLAALKKEYANAVLEYGKTSDEVQALAQKINILSDELADNKDKMVAAKDAAENTSDGFTILGGVLADQLSKGIDIAKEKFVDLATSFSEADANFQAQTGASTDEMQKFSVAMQDLYQNNYGESLQDIGDKMAYVKQVTGKVDPSDIRILTENAIALEDTFGSDFVETIRGVTNLMIHFGLDSQTAFDLFAHGSQLGLDYTDELGDNIAEYGGNFEQAGYSAQEYFQLLYNGSQSGAYNLDKVNDSINEIKNRIADGTISENIGIFSDGTREVFESWQNGKITMKEVINSIVSDINSCESEQDALTMAATAFGTMGEDANLKVVASLTTVGNQFDNVNGKMTELKNMKYSDIGSQFATVGRMIDTQIAQPLINTALPAVQGFAGFIIDNFPMLAPAITAVAVAFGVLAGALVIQNLINGVQKAFLALNITMLANPFVLVASGIAALVAGLIVLYNNCKPFKEFVDGLVTSVVTFFNSVKGMATTTWKGIKTAMTTPVTAAASALKSTFNGIKSTATSVFNATKSAITKPIYAAVSDVRGQITKIKGFFSGLKLSLPHISLPHFTLNGKFSLNPPSVPKLSVKWYAQGGVMQQPTIFGMAGNTLLGGGEAGPEAVAPIDVLQGYVADAVDAAMSRFSALSAEFDSSALLQKMDVLDATMNKYLPELGNLNVVLDDGTIVGKLVPKMDIALQRRANNLARGI